MLLQRGSFLFEVAAAKSSLVPTAVALQIRDPEQARINLTNFHICYMKALPRMSSHAQQSFSLLMEEVK